jgi:hypothetical protein
MSRRCCPGLGHRPNGKRDVPDCGLHSGGRHLPVVAVYNAFWEISVRSDGSDGASRGRLLAAARVDEFDSREHH